MNNFLTMINKIFLKNVKREYYENKIKEDKNLVVFDNGRYLDLKCEPKLSTFKKKS